MPINTRKEKYLIKDRPKLPVAAISQVKTIFPKLFASMLGMIICCHLPVHVGPRKEILQTFSRLQRRVVLICLLEPYHKHSHNKSQQQQCGELSRTAFQILVTIKLSAAGKSTLIKDSIRILKTEQAILCVKTQSIFFQTGAHTAGVRTASASPSSARILAISAFLSFRWSFFPSPLKRAAAASAGVSVELPACGGQGFSQSECPLQTQYTQCTTCTN